MTETTMSASEARRRFGNLLDRVAAEGENFIIERRGEPVAAVISIDAHRQWQSQRDAARARLSEFFETASARANMTPEEADALAGKSVADVRAEQQAPVRATVVEA